MEEFNSTLPLHTCSHVRLHFVRLHLCCHPSLCSHSLFLQGDPGECACPLSPRQDPNHTGMPVSATGPTPFPQLGAIPLSVPPFSRPQGAPGLWTGTSWQPQPGPQVGAVPACGTASSSHCLIAHFPVLFWGVVGSPWSAWSPRSSWCSRPPGEQWKMETMECPAGWILAL